MEPPMRRVSVREQQEQVARYGHGQRHSYSGPVSADHRGQEYYQDRSQHPHSQVGISPCILTLSHSAYPHCYHTTNNTKALLSLYIKRGVRPCVRPPLSQMCYFFFVKSPPKVLFFLCKKFLKCVIFALWKGPKSCFSSILSLYIKRGCLFVRLLP